MKRFSNEQIAFALEMRRGEIFATKTLGESSLANLLLKTIEWHTRVASSLWSAVFERG